MVWHKPRALGCSWMGLMADEIANQPKVLKQIVISVVETAPGQTATNVQWRDVDEITAYGLLEQARQVMQGMFMKAKMDAMPRVQPVNGMPDVLRHFRG
jgi:hypothetical protein